MEKSLFSQWVDKWFKAIALKVVETINGKKNGEPTYLHKAMLRKEFSTTLKWGSLSSSNTMVSADVVALDSSLPLKKRDKINRYEGDIPKLGMKLYLNEKTMQDIQILQNVQGQENEIITKLFADTKRCIVGINEALEYMFLQALSMGYCEIGGDENTGQVVRIDFGHPDENKFGADVEWSDADAKPLDDIKRVVKAAKDNGDVISVIMMSDAAFDKFSENTQVRQQFGFSQNFSGENVNIPVLDLDQANSMLQKKFRLQIQIVDRVVTFEKNGKRTAKTPWDANAVVFLTSTMVGTLTYGRLAEENHPAKQVTYEKVDDFILLSKYHKNDPIREFTSSQGLVVPVIDNVSSIYILDCEEAESNEVQTESDSTITIYEDSTVTVANLVNALNNSDVASKPAATTEMTDAQLISLVNKLSKAKETALRAILEIPVVDAGANTTASAATKAILGTATAAGDKTIVSTLWSHVSGPNTAGFADATALSTTATGLITGTYVLRLTVTDSEGTVASDTITITATVA